MDERIETINERAAAAAFNKQAALFDDLYSGDTIIQYKRRRVREHILKLLQPRSRILELNSGTGDDAIFLAKRGHKIHATDISVLMQNLLAEKAKQNNVQKSISCELRSFTDLENLSDKGPYDMIFSNFAGLNCTNELDKVLLSLNSLLKPGGIVTLVLLPKFSLWEFLLLFKGKFKTAFRRFSGEKGSKAHIEGEYFRCWYYNPSFIKKRLRNSFTLIGIEGLCSIVPPSYLHGFAEKYPSFFRKLVKHEEELKTRWPWKVIGDYYIISFRKTGK
jgi:ubiquinone/menaquinone biosynthesis C-methylase UbiE